MMPLECVLFEIVYFIQCTDSEVPIEFECEEVIGFSGKTNELQFAIG